MRAKMKIVGMGKRMQGVSPKTGKPYDFQSISFVFDDPYTTGFKAATANVDGPTLDAIGGVKLDQEYDMFYHGFKGAVYIDGIL